MQDTKRVQFSTEPASESDRDDGSDGESSASTSNLMPKGATWGFFSTSPKHAFKVRRSQTEKAPLASKRPVTNIRRLRTISLYIDGETESLSELLDEIGFGYYQCGAFFLCAGFMVASGAEAVMASCSQSLRGTEFGLTTPGDYTVISGYNFLGHAIGILVSGVVGDTLGRRIPILVGYAGIFIMSPIMCIVPGYVLHCTSLFLLGVFGGVGMPTAVVTVSEVTPAALRGLAIAAFAFAFVFGDLWGAIGLRIFMPDLETGSWRQLAIWIAIPSMIGLSYGLISQVTKYDTPYFLGVRGRNAELIDCINHIADMNGQPDAKVVLDKTVEVDSPGKIGFVEAIAHLRNWPLWLHFSVLTLLCCAKDFGAFGMQIFWPIAYRTSGRIPYMVPADELLLTVCLGFPGVFGAMYAMHYCARRQSLAYAAGSCALAVLIMIVTLGSSRLVVLGVATYRLAFPTWRMTTLLLANEALPTQVRVFFSSALEIVGSSAAFGAQTLATMDATGFLSTYAALAAVVALLVWFLPETKDCQLENIVDDPAACSKGDFGYGATSLTGAATV